MLFGDSEKSIPADVHNVLDAAALLQVSEFCLFQLAYRHWHGRDTTEQSIERHFVPYMFRSVVPFWVRQLVGAYYRPPQTAPSTLSISGWNRVALARISQ